MLSRSFSEAYSSLKFQSYGAPRSYSCAKKKWKKLLWIYSAACPASCDELSKCLVDPLRSLYHLEKNNRYLFLVFPFLVDTICFFFVYCRTRCSEYFMLRIWFPAGTCCRSLCKSGMNLVIMPCGERITVCIIIKISACG